VNEDSFLEQEMLTAFPVLTCNKISKVFSCLLTKRKAEKAGKLKKQES